MKSFHLLFCIMALFGLACTPCHAQSSTSHAEVKIKITLNNASNVAYLVQTPDGLRYRITLDNGTTELLSPDQFAARAYQDQTSRSFIEALFNISNPIGILWVSVGLLGQILFTGRMLVQWLVSEKAKRSVVPPLFWWLSLIGATMLTLYFLWRQDIVGVMGQAFGWLIYTRNLWMIYRPHNPHLVPVTNDPAPEPELEQ